MRGPRFQVSPTASSVCSRVADTVFIGGPYDSVAVHPRCNGRRPARRGAAKVSSADGFLEVGV